MPGGRQADDHDDEKFREIFDRLRETEGQTREQNAHLKALCDRIDNFASVTDRFFELEDKRHQADDQRFKALCEHEQRSIEAADRRFDKLWKLMTYLIGAVVALALGPKAAEKLYDTWMGGKKPITASYNPLFYSQDKSLLAWQYTAKTGAKA